MKMVTSISQINLDSEKESCLLWERLGQREGGRQHGLLAAGGHISAITRTGGKKIFESSIKKGLA